MIQALAEQHADELPAGYAVHPDMARELVEALEELTLLSIDGDRDRRPPAPDRHRHADDPRGARRGRVSATVRERMRSVIAFYRARPLVGVIVFIIGLAIAVC